jgi:hypothetical protein
MKSVFNGKAPVWDIKPALMPQDLKPFGGWKTG